MRQRHAISAEKFGSTIAKSRLINVGDQIGDADERDDIEIDLPDQPLLGMRVYLVRKSMYVGENSERDIIIGGTRSNGLLKLLRLFALLRRTTLSVCLDVLGIRKGVDVLGIIRHDEIDRDENGLESFYLRKETGCPLNSPCAYRLEADLVEATSLPREFDRKAEKLRSPEAHASQQ